MPRPSKGLTRQFRARITEDEYAILQAVITEHAQSGITLSQNDALRVLLRRGAPVLRPAPAPPPDEATARAAIKRHWAECNRCTEQDIRCAEGWRLKAQWDRATGTPPARRPLANRRTPA